MKIAVGSKNPVKVAAVREVASRVFPGAEVFGVECDSQASNQPLSDEDTLDGAIYRAREALAKGGADLGIGLEGGITSIRGRYFLCNWAAAVDSRERLGFGGGMYIELPRALAESVLAGEELGDTIDRAVGEKDIRRKQGTVGVLTGNLISRQMAFEMAATYALVRFFNEKFYEENR
ncbi:MAG: inosine/xanthosine triphosphatase [bacterium]